MTGGNGGSPLRVDTLTPVVTARPGTRVPCTVRVHNDGSQALSFSVRVVGLTADAPPAGVPWAPLQPGDALDVSVDVDVPEAMTPGEHAVAIEVMVTARATETSGVPRALAATSGSRAKPTVALAPLVVRVASLDQVLLRTSPSMVRGRRRARFSVEVINRRSDTALVDLAADGPTLDVELEPRSVSVPAGDTVVVQGRVRAPRMWRGEERQHIVNVEGSGSAQPTYTRLVFRQRPVIARGIRGVTAVIVVLSLWAALLGGAAFWVMRADKTASDAGKKSLVDTNGDGTPDTPAGEVGADGSTTGTSAPGTAGAPGGAPGTAPGTDPQSVLAPTSTRFTGVVKAGSTGDDQQVLVTLTSLVSTTDDPQAAEQAPEQTPAGFLTSAAAAMMAPFVDGVHPSIVGEGKFWSARHGTYAGNSLSENRATLAVTPKLAESDTDGIWTIDDVPLRRNYEVSFSKPGFDTQSFLVTPKDDGSPLKLDVELKAAVGALGGRVVSASGGLGGVDLTVTDGTLTFNTTTSTIPGEEGTWLIEGLSTPATYTITAVHAGYGTLVGQNTLDVGKSSRNLSFTMTQGVGSISGVVNNSKGSMGGVTLTATGEGATTTTTSLTAGATGSFLFPELKIGGTYTVTATAPGYITQTLLIDVGGNETATPIDLVRTTASVIGLVTSVAALGDTHGLPLPNAAVQISVDTLQVRASTAVAPDAGSFRLDELPPGTYTITFGRYDHLSDSRLVTVTAGQELDLGEIPLVFQQRAQLNPTGSVSVTVKRSSNNAALAGATITLTDIAGRLAPITPAPLGAATSITVPAVPVGVYELVVNVPNYRPFVEPRVAVGLTDVPIAAGMAQYGQAFGQVVDGLAPAQAVGTELISSRPLADYRMLVYEDVGGTLSCAGSVEVAPGAQKVQGRIRWEVGLSLQLLSGNYVLRFSRAAGDTNSACANPRLPPGYAANPDGAGNVGGFEVTASDAPIPVLDISVFPFPKVTGVVLVPSSSTSVVFDPATSAITGLTVRLKCGTLTATAAIIPVTSGADTLTTFVFDRNTVGTMFANTTVPSSGVLGSCSVVADAPGVVKVDSPLPQALQMPLAGNYDDRALAIVLADDPQDLTGTVAWTDAGTQELKLLGGTIVAANGVIVGFQAGQGIDTDGPGSSTVVPGDPQPEPRNISATANGQGVWTFSTTGQQQVAGTSTYNVAPPNFDPGSFDLLVDQGTRAISNATGFTQPFTAVGPLDLRLHPLDGSIRGSMLLITGSSVNRINEAVVHATPPGQLATDIAVNTDGTFTIDPAAAGTWQLDYRAVSGSNLVLAQGESADSKYVGPNVDESVDPVTYVDLAEVGVTFKASDGTALGTYQVGLVDYPSVAVTQVSPNPVYPTFAATDVVANATGRALLHGLSVDAVSPVAVPVDYQLAVAADGYDLTTASYKVFADDDTTAFATGIDARSIPVQVSAGTRLRVEVTLPQLGSISGSVTGLLRPPSILPTDIEALTWAGGLQVTVEEVADAGGTPLPTPLFPTVEHTTGPPDSFLVNGLYNGYYKVTYSHPDFVSRSVVYEAVVDTEVDASAALDIASSTFELTVVTDTVSENPVLGATVGLWPAGTTVAQAALTSPTYSTTTDAITGIASFSPTTGNAIIPGSYLLIVRKADPTDLTRDGWFPVIATIEAPRGADEAARTLSRRAVMPETQASLVGTVTARNLAGHAVPLPASITIDRTYHVPQAGGGDGLPNDATEANQIDSPDTTKVITPTAGATTDGYSFTGLAAGDHTLHFTPVDGFTDVADVDVTANGVGPTTVDPVELVATDRTWQVTLTNSGTPVSGLTVSALAPDGSVVPPATELAAPKKGTYEFVGVRPEGADYTIVINSLYYTATTAGDLSVNIEPSSTTEVSTVPVTAVAIITGSAFELTTATTQVAFTTTDGVELLNAAGAVVDTATPDVNGAYQFVVASAEDYSVRASATGFVGALEQVDTFTLGQTISAPTLNLKALASVTLTVGGTPGGTATVTATPATGVAIVESTPGVFAITGLDPDVGYTFDVSATGFAARTVPATGTHDPAIGGNAPLSIALEALRTISGDVLQGVAKVAGANVTLLQGGVAVGAPKQSDANGAFSFSGIGYGTYTIAAEKLGSGTGSSASIVVAVGGSTTLTGSNVTLTTLRPLTFTFAVTPTTTPTITFSGVTGTAGQVTFVINENAGRAWSVSAPGYLTLSGTADLPSAYTATAQSVSVALTANAITGTVTGLVSPATAKVYLCVTTGDCDPGTNLRSKSVNSTSTGFSFSAVAPGSYRLVVRSGGNFSADFAVSVDATGAVTGSPVDIPVPVPPPPTP